MRMRFLIKRHSMNNRNKTAAIHSADASNIKVPLPKIIPNPNASEVNKTNPESLRLLNALWRTTDHYYQIGELNRSTGLFRNIPVENALNAVSSA